MGRAYGDEEGEDDEGDDESRYRGDDVVQHACRLLTPLHLPVCDCDPIGVTITMTLRVSGVV